MRGKKKTIRVNKGKKNQKRKNDGKYTKMEERKR